MKVDVFISHHTKSSLKITEAICNNLESKNIRCWYAPRNTVGAYAKSIVEAINNCKIFLLILNKEASYSEDVLNEINLAVERVRASENISIIPFHISNEDISQDAKYYIGRMHWIDAITPPLEKRIEELSQRISYLLNLNDEITEEKNVSKKMLKGNKYLVNPNFIARDAEMKQIEDNLQAYGRVVLNGMGGIGKSEIAKQYANLNKDKYKTIIFAIYDGSIKNMILNEDYFYIEDFYRKIDENGNKENDDIFFERKLKEIFKITNDETLIIVDNFDTEKDKKKKKLLEGNYHIIFTSRNDLKKYKLPIVNIKELSESNKLLELFKENYYLNLSKEDESIVLEIISKVNGHTLAILLIASIMQDLRIKPEIMLDNLNNSGINPGLKGEVSYNFKEFESIYQCISKVFDMSSLSKEEKYILSMLYVFPISGCDFEFFMKLCDIHSAQIINGLIKKSFISYNYITDVISLHPVIASVVKNEFNVSDKNYKVLFNNIAKEYSWYLSLKEKEKYVDIIKSIYQKFPNIDKDNLEYFLKFSFFLRDVCDFEIAEKIFFEILKIAEKINEYPNLGYLYHQIAYLYHKKNDYNEAKVYYTKMINYAEENEDYRLLCDGYKSLFSIFLAEKDITVAKKYLDDAYRIFNDQGLQKDRILDGSFCLDFAKAYYELEEYNTALDFANKAYEILSENHMIKNNDIASVSRVLGQIYLKLEDYEKAILALNEAVEIREEYFVSFDANLLKYKELLADAYVIVGKNKEAYTIYKEILNILETKYYNTQEWCKLLSEKIENIV